MSTTQAVILAGGEGKRIHPLGINKPKCMFAIMGKPLIQFVIENLKSCGIEDIIVVTGPNKEQIQTYFGDGSALGVKLQYTVQEKPIGQANAIQTAAHLIHNPFLVLNANDIFESTLIVEMLTKAEAEGVDLLLAGRKVAEPWRFGVMRFDEGKLVGVIEKPPQGEAPSDIGVVGVYYFTPEIFRRMDETPLTDTDDQLERAYQKLIDAGSASFVAYEGMFESYKFPWNLLTISDLLLRLHVKEQFIHPTAKVSDRAVIGDNVYISENVKIFENAVIRGPAYLGPGCVIGNNALIWGGCSFGRGCVMGYGSEIKHAVLGNNVWTHRTYVGDSIVSDNCSFGAGTITANYRFDEQNVALTIKEQAIDTGMDKLGVIMAEGCRTGSNSVLMPGLRIGPNSIVGPGVTLLEDLPPNKIALSQSTIYAIKENRLNLMDKSREDLLGTMLKKS